MNDEAKPVKKRAAKKQPEPLPECFVMMPLGIRPQWPDHSAKHWEKVFDELLAPAAELAGYKAKLASQNRETNIFQVDILQGIVEAPMAICDLSTHNGNVLFELGLRQAFDKPVVLVAEEGTPSLADIQLFRYQKYRSGLLYSDVLEDQKAIAAAIKATKEAIGTSVNSLVHLLALKPAKLPEPGKENTEELMRYLIGEMQSLKQSGMMYANILGRPLPPPPPRSLYELGARRDDALRGIRNIFGGGELEALTTYLSLEEAGYSKDLIDVFFGKYSAKSLNQIQREQLQNICRQRFDKYKFPQ